jgi:hypothetical protein
VYYRSASFQLRGNETELEQVTPNTGAFNNQPSSSSGSNGASSSTTSGAPRATSARTDAAPASRANMYASGAVALVVAGLACVA